MLEPFAVFEEVRSIIFVKVIPPFSWVGIESAFRMVSQCFEPIVEQNFAKISAIQIGAKDIADLFRSWAEASDELCIFQIIM